jgi:integrase
VNAWQKVADKRAPFYLEVRHGKYRTSYRVNYRGHGLDLRQVLEGDFENWKSALKEADIAIAKARFGHREGEKQLIRCEEIAEQLIAESHGQDESTVDGKKRIFRKHLVPWLNEHYPYAVDLTVETWPKYKLFKRQEEPTIALENHVKYMRMLCKRAFELGLVKPKITIKFNVEKEEFREEGLKISDEDLAKMLAAASFRKSTNADGSPSHGQGLRVWYCRIVIQRDTGMRPGEVRKLRKSPITTARGKTLPANVELLFDEKNPTVPTAVKVRLFKEETKTHRYREFIVRSPRAVGALFDRCSRYPESPYLFPMETDHQRPMDKHLGGWKSILKNAGVRADYTPHDLRHTYASEMFQRTSNYAALCYQLDMSLETAQEVYIHLDAKDTADLADVVANETAPRTDALAREILKEKSGS